MAVTLTVVTEHLTPYQRHEWLAEFDDVKHQEDRRRFAANLGG